MNACAVLKPRPVNIIPILLVIALVWMVAASWHAVMKHGPDALDAQNCFNGKGTIRSVFMDPHSGQKMSICQMYQKFFVSIDRPDGSNVTMFPKDYAKCLQDVVQYVKRSGFTVPVK